MLEVLVNEPLEFAEGVAQCEKATQKLDAMIKSRFDGGVSDMSVVRERVSLFQSYANDFALRLSAYLSGVFQDLAAGYLADESRSAISLRIYGHEDLEVKLFGFRNLLTWLKNAEARVFRELQLVYASTNNNLEIHQ